MIGKTRTTIGDLRHVVQLAQLQQVSDGDGGIVDEFVPLDPPDWKCSIAAATLENMERVLPDVVQASATHVLRGRYRPDVTPHTTALYGDRRFDVVSVQDVEERRQVLILICSEIVHV